MEIDPRSKLKDYAGRKGGEGKSSQTLRQASRHADAENWHRA
jgi:hypothetical protein